MVASAVSLPVAQPLVQSYLFLAYPLAILAGQGRAARRWVLSNFVQLYCRPGGDLMFYAHPWSPADELRRVALTCCPFLDVQQLDQRLVGKSLVPFLQHCIEVGLYPQIDIDYGCLPWEQRGSWLHEILLCGLDRHAGVFEVLAYTPDGSFRVMRVDTDTIEVAAAAAAAITHKTPQARERPRLLLYRFVHASSADPDRERMDVSGLCDHLWDYLEAADSSLRHRAIAPRVQAVWGVDTGAMLESRAQDCDARSTLRIPLRVWWEHKRLMALRFAQLERDGLLNPSLKAGPRAAHVASLAWQARLMALRWRGRGVGRRLAGLLRETVAQELDNAGAVVNALSSVQRLAA